MEGAAVVADVPPPVQGVAGNAQDAQQVEAQEAAQEEVPVQENMMAGVLDAGPGTSREAARTFFIRNTSLMSMSNVCHLL